MRVLRRPALLVFALSLALTACASGLFGRSLKSKVASRLEQRLSSGAFPDGLLAREEIQLQYRSIDYSPAWISSSGIAKSALELVDLYPGVEAHGLQPEDYHASQVTRLVGELKNLTDEQLKTEPVIDRLAELELVLSDSFLRLAQDFYKGRVDPRVGDPEWYVRDGKPDLLTKAIETVERSGTTLELLKELRLESAPYAKLKDALYRYRQIQAAGGWPPVPGWGRMVSRAKAKVNPGGRDAKRIPALRRRLAVTGDLQTVFPVADTRGSSGLSPATAMGPFTDETFLDSELVVALKQFQIRHGLEPDGVLGGDTLSELNVPVDTRVRQLEASLERLRWLPRPIGSRYILVNITDYSLSVIEKDESKLSMKVVVGQEARRTPSFLSPLRKMVINPNWFVPQKLAAGDLLPILQKNPEGLVHKGFKVFKRKKTGMELVDPLKVDWKRVTAENFPYKIIQAPGPYNSLGEIKFMPPNPFRIFLHGTPKKELFRKKVRTFSSGCIRIEQPIDLAEYVMKGDSDWDRDSLIKEILKGTNRSVKLPRKIPLYLLYRTAWVDSNDQVNFRKDIYGRDAVLAAALQWSPAKIQWELKRLAEAAKPNVAPATSPAQPPDRTEAPAPSGSPEQPARVPAAR